MSVTRSRTALLDHGLALDTYLQELLGGAAASGALPRGPRCDISDAEPTPSGPAQEPARRAGPLRVRVLQVAGVSLAVPLERVNRVITGNGQLKALSATVPLLLGVLSYPGGEAWVVDTAGLILPRDNRPRRAADASQFVVLDEGRLALACTGIGEIMELQDSDVNWRTAAGKRPWLAGTVLRQMCALLDIDAVTGLLGDTMAR